MTSLTRRLASSPIVFKRQSLAWTWSCNTIETLWALDSNVIEGHDDSTSFSRSFLSLVRSSWPVGISSSSPSSFPSPGFGACVNNIDMKNKSSAYRHNAVEMIPVQHFLDNSPMRNHPKVSNCLTVSGRSFNWLASSITLFQLPDTITYSVLQAYITNLLPLLFRYQFPALPQGASHGRTFSLSVLRGFVGGESDCWAWPGIPRLCWQQGQISFREEDLLLR